MQNCDFVHLLGGIFAVIKNKQLIAVHYQLASLTICKSDVLSRSGDGVSLFAFMKLTYDYVRDVFEAKGYRLISTEYKNARTHLKYVCPAGHEGQVIFDSFRRGHGCNSCAQIQRNNLQSLSHEDVAKFFQENNCELLSKYKSSRQPVMFRCKCGKVSTIQYANFKYRRRCTWCGLEARSGSKHYEWKCDREKLRQDRALKVRLYGTLRSVRTTLGIKKNGRSKSILGYTLDDLKSRIEKHPNWELVKDKKWHLDHIFPVQAFLDFGLLDFSLINSLDNLQPLEAAKNISKSDNYDVGLFRDWLKSKGVIL